MTDLVDRCAFRKCGLLVFHDCCGISYHMDTQNTGNVSGLLLYAKTEDEVFPDGKPFVIGGNRISAKTLDLNQAFPMIAGQLERIVAEYFGEA